MQVVALPYVSLSILPQTTALGYEVHHIEATSVWLLLYNVSNIVTTSFPKLLK